MNILIIILIIIVILYLFRSTKENLTNNNDLVDKIIQFITSKTTYSEYLDFLVTNKNRSYNILSQESFFEIKLLLKQGNLTSQAINQYMSDVK